MASSRYLAENVVDALFEDDFGLSNEDNSENDEDDHIYGYLESSYFTPAEHPMAEVEDRGSSGEEDIPANEVEFVGTNDELSPEDLPRDLLTEVELPVIHEDEYDEEEASVLLAADSPSATEDERSEDSAPISDTVTITIK